MENTAQEVGLSDKYSTRESRVLYLSRDSTLSAVFFCTSQVNGALTDLLFCVGGLVLFCSDGLSVRCFRQVRIIGQCAIMLYRYLMQ